MTKLDTALQAEYTPPCAGGLPGIDAPEFCERCGATLNDECRDDDAYYATAAAVIRGDIQKET